jgi:hypothetical protein
MLEAGTSNYNYKSNTTVEVEGVASLASKSTTRRWGTRHFSFVYHWASTFGAGDDPSKVCQL